MNDQQAAPPPDDEERTIVNQKQLSEGIATRELPLDEGDIRTPNTLYFEDLDTGKSVFVAREKSELIIGRPSYSTGVLPDVDLTPLGAKEKGVSRNHARLLSNGDALYIQDLNSSNGTRVRGRPLGPMAIAGVRNGFIIEFGGLGVRLIVT